MSVSFAPAGSHVPLLAVDERVVAPESRYEIHDGRVLYVSASDEPHGSRHSKASALLEAYAAEDYDVASDMLTRTSETNDMAPDVSVFPRERDPSTGGRQIEALAFEIVSTEKLSAAGAKARKLVGRGVRRVFAVDVARQRAFEWSRAVDGWQVLPPGSKIEDPVLALALPIDALVHAAKVDDAIAVALLAKNNPILEAALANAADRARADGRIAGERDGRIAGERDGRIAGRAEAVLAVLAARGLEATAAERTRILASKSVPEVDAWLAAAARCSTVTELFGAASNP